MQPSIKPHTQASVIPLPRLDQLLSRWKIEDTYFMIQQYLGHIAHLIRMPFFQRLRKASTIFFYQGQPKTVSN